MSSDEVFSADVRLVHRFGRWRLRVNSRERNVSAQNALMLAGELSEMHPTDLTDEVRDVIRRDADEAEEAARKADEHVRTESARLASSAVSARQRALERRREANHLCKARLDA
jgi:hypothetical protein